MDNYEYIIASLPELHNQPNVKESSDEIIDFIQEQLSSRDRVILKQLLEGFDASKLDKNFYQFTQKSRNSFIKGFFNYDLLLRNLKVQYLNEQLGRSEFQDTIALDYNEQAPILIASSQEEDADKIRTALHQNDILSRERSLDDLLWSTIDELTKNELFSLNLILAFVAKLQIVQRWHKLDPETGRKLLREAIDAIRSTYDNKKQNII